MGSSGQFGSEYFASSHRRRGTTHVDAAGLFLPALDDFDDVGDADVVGGLGLARADAGGLQYGARYLLFDQQRQTRIARARLDPEMRQQLQRSVTVDRLGTVGQRSILIA